MSLHLYVLLLVAVSGTSEWSMVPGEGCGSEKEIHIFESISEDDLPLPGCSIVKNNKSFQKVYLPFKGISPFLLFQLFSEQHEHCHSTYFEALITKMFGLNSAQIFNDKNNAPKTRFLFLVILYWREDKDLGFLFQLLYFLWLKYLLFYKDSQLSPWTTWSSCSRSCDQGFRFRERFCKEEAEEGGAQTCNDLYKSEACKIIDCLGGKSTDQPFC